jgi:hypothetical protein
MRRFLTSAAAVAALAIGVGIELAVAGDYKVDSKVRIETLGLTEIEGHVKAERYFCINDRDVTLYRETPGSDPKVGSDHGNSQGAWAIRGTFLPLQEYYAKVSRKAKRKNGYTHVCRAGRSPTKRLLL